METFEQHILEHSVAFLESCVSISEGNECLTGENIKRNQKPQRKR